MIEGPWQNWQAQHLYCLCSSENLYSKPKVTIITVVLENAYNSGKWDLRPTSTCVNIMVGWDEATGKDIFLTKWLLLRPLLTTYQPEALAPYH